MSKTNSKYLRALLRSKTEGRMTPDLYNLFNELTNKIGNSPRFKNYSFINEARVEALEWLCKGWDKPNLSKSTNIYAYYVSCAHGSFIRYIHRELKKNGQ